MTKDFTLTFLADQSPSQVFKAIINVRGWWQGFYNEQIDGKTDKVNDEFSFRAGDGAHQTEQKLIELVPDKRVVWLVTFSKLSFIEKQDEWKGTRLVFEITATGNKTQVRFTHQGLVPDIECYEACSSGWKLYLEQKLLRMINK
jgi:hypothetical protein